MNAAPRVFWTLSLASSCLFFLGVLLAWINYFLLFFDTENQDDRKTRAVLGITAWTLVATSTILELWIDLVVGRQSPHSRYGSRFIWNLLQTASLAGGSVCQGMATKRQWDYGGAVAQNPFFREKDYYWSWEDLFLLSVCFMSVSGLLAVVTTGCCCCGGGAQRPIRFNQSANGMFFGASIALVFAGVTDGFGDQSFHGFLLLSVSYSMYCACGFMWMSADLLLSKVVVVGGGPTAGGGATDDGDTAIGDTDDDDTDDDEDDAIDTAEF